MRLPSSPRIAAAFPVSRHAAQTATVARGGGARGEKRTVGQGGEGCRGARLKAKAVVLTAVGDVVVEDCNFQTGSLETGMALEVWPSFSFIFS